MRGGRRHPAHPAARGEGDAHQLVEHRGGALDGRNGYCVMYTANADTPGPYGAAMSSGKSLRYLHPQAQVPATVRYSATSRRITCAMTWRRSGNSSATSAGTGSFERHDYHLLGRVHQGSGCSRVASLSAWRACPRLASGARRWFARWGIAGRWLTRVVAVLAQARLQLRNPCPPPLDDCCLPRDQGRQSLQFARK